MSYLMNDKIRRIVEEIHRSGKEYGEIINTGNAGSIIKFGENHDGDITENDIIMGIQIGTFEWIEEGKKFRVIE